MRKSKKQELRHMVTKKNEPKNETNEKTYKTIVSRKPQNGISHKLYKSTTICYCITVESLSEIEAFCPKGETPPNKIIGTKLKKTKKLDPPNGVYPGRKIWYNQQSHNKIEVVCLKGEKQPNKIVGTKLKKTNKLDPPNGVYPGRKIRYNQQSQNEIEVICPKRETTKQSNWYQNKEN